MSSSSHDPLQRWLDAIRDGAGDPPPEGLEPEVVETVYALRPDLAPAPRLSIDDILDAVEEGPLAAPTSPRAAALGSWLDRRAENTDLLDEDADEADDLDLDPEALEAIYALRPDLAPAPRLSIDDIFDAVETGPFARQAEIIPLHVPSATAAATEVTAAVPAETAAEQVADAATTTALTDSGAEVVSLAERRRARMWWAGPGLGALLAAAAVLLVVQPMGLAPSSPVDPALDGARYAPAAAEAPPAAAAPAADAAPWPRAPSPDPAPLSSPVITATGRPDAEPASVGSTFAETGGAEKDRASALVPAPTSATTAAPQEQLQALGYLEGDASVAVARNEALRAPMVAEEPAPPPPPGTQTVTTSSTTTTPARPSLDGSRAVAPRDEDALAGRSAEAGGLVTEAEDSIERSRRTWGITPRREDRPSAPSASADMPEAYAVDDANMDLDEAAAEMDFAEEESVSQSESRSVPAAGAGSSTPRGQSSDTTDADSLSALKARAAWSMGGIPDVKATDAAWGRAAAEAQTQVQAGNLDAALSIMAPFQGSAVPDVRMDAAWERARIYLRQSQVQVALRSVDAGLAVVGGDPRLRARLLYQKGQLLERLGDPEGAVRAYQAAAALR